MRDPMRMDWHEMSRLRAAAHHARRVYPGPVGELVAQELLSWEEFGYRLGPGARIVRLVEDVLRTPVPDSDVA